MSIIVMGSAPVSTEVPAAERTYFASAAAHQMANRKNFWGEICCVFPIGVVETGRPEPELSIFLRHAPYDRLFLRSSLWSLINPYEVQTYISMGNDLRDLSYRDMVSLWVKHIGVSSLLFSWFKGAKMRNYIFLILNTRPKKVSWFENFCSVLLSTSHTKISSGVLSILLAIEESDPEQQINVFGVTLARQEYSYEMSPSQLSDGIKGHEGHMEADKQALVKLFRKHSSRLHFDDENLRSFLSDKY